MIREKCVELSALKGLMREHKVTYRVLAKDIGMSLNALNSKLNGYSSFNLEEAEKIINYLKIKDEEIVKYFFPFTLRNATKNNRHKRSM